MLAAMTRCSTTAKLPTSEVPLPRLLDPFTRAAFDLTIGHVRASRRCAAMATVLRSSSRFVPVSSWSRSLSKR
jgi:hypothetical protein